MRVRRQASGGGQTGGVAGPAPGAECATASGRGARALDACARPGWQVEQLQRAGCRGCRRGRTGRAGRFAFGLTTTPSTFQMYFRYGDCSLARPRSMPGGASISRRPCPAHAADGGKRDDQDLADNPAMRSGQQSSHISLRWRPRAGPGVEKGRDPTHVSGLRREGLRVEFTTDNHVHADFVSGGGSWQLAGADARDPGSGRRSAMRRRRDGRCLRPGGA